MKEYLKEVKDIFNIHQRIREIDDGYRIFYNTKLSRFEIHNLNQKKDTFALVVPYDQIDARVITLVRKSRVENFDKIINEIEESNEKILKKEKDAKLRAIEKLEALKSKLI